MSVDDFKRVLCIHFSVVVQARLSADWELKKRSSVTLVASSGKTSQFRRVFVPSVGSEDSMTYVLGVAR